jgi:hypothetical protein
MSRFSMRYKSPVDSPDAFLAAVEPFAREYPETASVFAGEVESDGTWSVPPFNVRLFINGGVMKFQISRAKEKLSGYGVISNPRNVLESIEKALQAGEVGWKAESEQTPSF